LHGHAMCGGPTLSSSSWCLCQTACKVLDCYWLCPDMLLLLLLLLWSLPARRRQARAPPHTACQLTWARCRRCCGGSCSCSGCAVGLHKCWDGWCRVIGQGCMYQGTLAVYDSLPLGWGG
jgi:hypothetical protein